MRTRFWLRLAGYVLAVGFGGGAFMCLYMLLINSGMELRDTLGLLPFYILTMGAMGEFIYSWTLWRCYLSVAVSFGCTRREALGGIQLMLLSSAAVLLAGITATAALTRGELGELLLRFVPGTAGLLVGVGALGGMIGVLQDRFRALGVVVFVFFLVICSVTGGLLAGAGLELSFLASGALRWNLCTLLAGLLLWAGCVLLQHRLLRSYAVHF